MKLRWLNSLQRLLERYCERNIQHLRSVSDEVSYNYQQFKIHYCTKEIYIYIYIYTCPSIYTALVEIPWQNMIVLLNY